MASRRQAGRTKSQGPLAGRTGRIGRVSERRFNRHSPVYYYESRAMVGGKRKVGPGVVVSVSADGKVCNIRYRYDETDPRKKATVQVRMDSALLSMRPSREECNVMLNKNIFASKYKAGKYGSHTWYDLHLIAEKERLAKEKQEEQQRVAKEKHQKEQQDRLDKCHNNWYRVGIALQKKRALQDIFLTKMQNIAKQQEICRLLACRIDDIDLLPNCTLIPKKLYDDSKCHQNVSIVRLDVLPWGTVTRFQTKALQLYKEVMSGAGALVRHIHLQQSQAHARALQRIRRVGVVGRYSIAQWIEMEVAVPALSILDAHTCEMTNPPQSTRALERTKTKIFVVRNLHRRLSSESFKEPFAGLLTQKLIYGGMERKRIEELNDDFYLGTTPKVLDVKSDSTETQARRYSLPGMLIFGGSKQSKLRVAKNMHDNYGKAIANGKRADGTTCGVVTVHDEDLPGELVTALNAASHEEIPITQAGIESIDDLLPGLEQDSIALLYFAMFVADVHSQVDIVNGSESKKNLKLHTEYMDHRIQGFSANQQHRTSRHDKIVLEDGELLRSKFEPSPFWESWEEEMDATDDIVDGTHIPNEFAEQWWDHMAVPVHWGFELYGNNTMRFLIDRFVHAEYKDGTRVFPTADDTDVVKINVGDAAPGYRHLRAARGHRNIVAEGGDTIAWEDSMQARGAGGDQENIVEWTNSEDKATSAGVGARLLHIGFPDNNVKLVGDGGPGHLQVSINGGETVELTSQHFVPWNPKVGDEFDFSHMFYQTVGRGTGHFHMLAATTKRSVERNKSGWLQLVQAKSWRKGENAAAYLLGAGDFKVTIFEFSSGSVGIMIFTILVYQTIHANGSLKGMLQWMNELRVKSGAWNQVWDMAEDMSDVHLYRNSCRTSNMEGIDTGASLFCELFAQTGASQYFQLASQWMLDRKSESDYKHLLGPAINFNNHSAQFLGCDLTVEHWHFLMSSATGKQHGLLPMVHNTARVAAELPDRYPYWSTKAKMNDKPGGTLGGMPYDPTIALSVVESLRASGLGDLQGVLLHTGKPVVDDPHSSVVYTYGNDRVVKECSQQDDVGRARATLLMERDVFNNNCNSVHKTSPQAFDRNESTQTDQYRQAVIDVSSMGEYTALAKKPFKKVFWDQSQVLINAARNNLHRPPNEILRIGRLRDHGAGSTADKAELQKYVLPAGANGLLIVHALIRFKRKSIVWAKRVLHDWYAREGTDMVGLVKRIKEGPYSAEKRRAASLERILPLMQSIQFKEKLPVPNVEGAANELMDFLKENDKATPSWKKEEKKHNLLNIDTAELKLSMGLGGRGNSSTRLQKPLPEMMMKASNEVSRMHKEMERKARGKHSRKVEMEQCETSRHQRAIEMTAQRRAEVDQRDPSESRWVGAVTGLTPTIPLSFLRQSIEQATREANANQVLKDVLTNENATVAIVESTLAGSLIKSGKNIAALKKQLTKLKKNQEREQKKKQKEEEDRVKLAKRKEKERIREQTRLAKKEDRKRKEEARKRRRDDKKKKNSTKKRRKKVSQEEIDKAKVAKEKALQQKQMEAKRKRKADKDAVLAEEREEEQATRDGKRSRLQQRGKRAERRKDKK